MTVKQIERKLEQERKSNVTVSDLERKEAFDRGFNCFNNGVKCLHHDSKYSSKLYKMTSANMIELGNEWNNGFHRANFA